MRISALLALIMVSSGVLADFRCPHQNALHCPQVEAPRVTELREGLVRIKYLVTELGEVRNIIILETAGDPRWVNAVENAVRKWRYQHSDVPYEMEYLFHARLEE